MILSSSFSRLARGGAATPGSRGFYRRSPSAPTSSPSPPSPGGPGSPENREGGTPRCRRWTLPALLTPALLAFTSCVTSPVTGTRSFILLTVSDDVQIGNTAYGQVLAQEELITSGPDYDMVVRIMDRIVAVSDDPGFEWEVSLIHSDETVNAFALPGGKMAVYTGILPVAGTEAGLAVVMGHEIGHVVARHGSQRLTLNMGTSWVAKLIGGENQDLAAIAADLLVQRPYGRKQELEADHIGVIYMARAGYDPREAVEFWSRMSQGGSSSPEILSTHPSDEARIGQLEDLLPEALAEWQASGGVPTP